MVMKRALIITILVTSCGNNFTRPLNIPLDTVFVDGRDGGAFVQCNQNRINPKTYHCVIYNDRNGEIWSEGTYAVASGDSSFNPNDKQIYSSYDLGRLFLNDGRCLIKIHDPNAALFIIEAADACLR